MKNMEAIGSEQLEIAEKHTKRTEGLAVSVSADDIKRQSAIGVLERMRVTTSDLRKDTAREPVMRGRKALQAVLDDETLLRQFVKVSGDDLLEFHMEKIPRLVREAATKAGMADDSVVIEMLEYEMLFGDYRSIRMFFEDTAQENVYEAIREYADYYFATKHAVEMTEKAKIVVSRLFPQLYREFPLVTGMMHIKDYVNATHTITKTGKHQLMLYSREGINNIRDFADAETKGVFEKDYTFKRRNADLVMMIHEYAHGIYAEFTNPERIDTQGDYYNTADAALNEGFAVMVELLACDGLINEADALGLDERDCDDLREWKRQRIRSLHRIFQRTLKGNAEERTKARGKEGGMAYTEGVIEFMHKVYKERGIEGFVEFLRTLDARKTLSTPRDSEAYRSVLGVPENFEALFTKASRSGA